MVTGLLNAIFVYAVAFHLQHWLSRVASQVWGKGQIGNKGDLDVEAARPQRHETTRPDVGTGTGVVGVPGAAVGSGGGGDRVSDQSCLDRFRKHISDVSTLCTLSGYSSDLNGPNLACVEEGRRGAGGQPEDALRVLDGSGPGATKRSSLFLRLVLVAVETWMQQNIFLTSSILLFLLVGLPLSCLRHNDLCLDIGFLFTVWLTFTSAQTKVKVHIQRSRRPQCQNGRQCNHHRRRHHPPDAPRKPVLTALATLLNPVLWTSLFLLCYGLAKSHIRAEPTAAVVLRFQTGNTLSDLVAHHVDTRYLALSPPPALPLGAGDLAAGVLNAGIVSWGLKLFECRRQLVSRGGGVVLLTSALAALANVAAGPLLAHALGVRPAAFDLSFAARSVTIALGGPAVAALGGDAGVNAVGVVVNGICFQLVAGFFVGGEEGFEGAVRRWRGAVSRLWAGKGGAHGAGSASEIGVPDGEKGRRPSGPLVPAAPALWGTSGDDNIDNTAATTHNSTPRYSSDATHVDGRRPGHDETTAPGPGECSPPSPLPLPSSTQQTDEHDDGNDDDDVGSAVAAGVTIGINAAAMGTAHLYEQGSRAAPYSALSMTVFGVLTVLFTTGSPMVEWLKTTVAS